MKYYSLERILRENATYNMVFGERSNGKTFAALQYAIEQYWSDGSHFAYVRRWREDITGRRAAQLFAGLNHEGEISRITEGAFDGVHYYAGAFYLCTYGADGKPLYNPEDVVGYTFALSVGEHDKSTTFPELRTIIFDEFLTNRLYLKDEFVLFMNTVSTIVRRRDDVRIFMLGNTVSRHSPYFEEMGLNHAPTMKQGSLDVYTYGESELTVAVEYCATDDRESPSAKYFAFDNPKLAMITGGAWEIDLYRRKPAEYTREQVMLTFYIRHAGAVFFCDVVDDGDGGFYAYIYDGEGLTPPDEREDLIYDLSSISPRLNVVQSIHKPTGPAQKRILWFFVTGRVYYQSNAIGDTIANYLTESKRV